MKVVEFIQQMAPYNEGETAAFTDEQADALLHRKLVKMRPDITPTTAQRSPEQDPPPHLATQIARDLHAMQQGGKPARA